MALSVLSCLLSSAALLVSLNGASGTPSVSPPALIAAETAKGPVTGERYLRNPAAPAPAQGSAMRGKGSCRAEDRGISSFACPGTPTEDVCGIPPYLTCFLGPDESCPPGKAWDPSCSCTCI